MTNRERALEVAHNINRTLKTLKTTVIGNNAVRGNGIWTSTKPSRSMLEKKLTLLCEKHDIKIEEL